jgi:hypothetical protein
MHALHRIDPAAGRIGLAAPLARSVSMSGKSNKKVSRERKPWR